MELKNKRIVWGITSSAYAVEKTIPQIEKLILEGTEIIPIMSFNSCNIYSNEIINKIENITGKCIIHTIQEAEAIRI